MKSILGVVAVLTIVAVAFFMMGAPMADAGFGCGYGYGYGYSSYCAPCYNTFVLAIRTCVPYCAPSYYAPYYGY
jgi:hypothetical protein